MQLRDAAILTGYAYNTLAQYATPCARRHQPWGRFPAPTPDSTTHRRRWVIADLARWAAGRDPRKGLPVLSDEQVADIMARLDAGETRRQAGAHHGVSLHAVRHLWDLDEPGRKRAGRTGRTGFPGQKPGEPEPSRPFTRVSARRRVALDFVTGLVLAHPAITWPEARQAAARAGIPLPNAARIYREAQAAALPVILDRIVPRHPSGLASATEIAAAFGVTRQRAWGAVKRGEILAIRKGRLILADPARLRFRRTRANRKTSAAPVDMDHPDAIPMPLGAVFGLFLVAAVFDLLVLIVAEAFPDRFQAKTAGAGQGCSLLPACGHCGMQVRDLREPAKMLGRREHVSRRRLLSRHQIGMGLDRLKVPEQAGKVGQRDLN